MPTVQHIESLTLPPVIGQAYLVPTVLYPWFGKEDAWPVMGPKHTDAEHVRFHDEHYHVDLRFLTERQVRRVEKAAYRPGGIMMAAASAPLATKGDDRRVLPHPDPVVRRLLCRRDAHAYPLWEARRQPGLQALAQAYADRRCGRDAAGHLICPHKGFVLDSLKPDENGRVVCPLHGLVIDTRAGVVVPAMGINRG